jgi:hypothetical protein
LRGYRSPAQQYAAIDHYEELAGRICEDYPRDPPAENRRYKSELRDPVFARRGNLTPEERAKVNRADSGEHWVKVTFESAEAADAAIFASPQAILGCLVFAEPYHGLPPTRDEAVPDPAAGADDTDERQHRSPARGMRLQSQRPPVSALPKSFAGASVSSPSDFSPPHSHTSSRTADTTTLTSATSSSTVSSGTITGATLPTGHDPSGRAAGPESIYYRAIPSARKIRILPAEQALLPQPSYTQRVLNRIPFLKWFSGTMIGNEVPRTETGEFDWDRASLYWKFIFWLDYRFGLFGGEILNADKDD